MTDCRGRLRAISKSDKGLSSTEKPGQSSTHQGVMEGHKGRSITRDGTNKSAKEIGARKNGISGFEEKSGM